MPSAGRATAGDIVRPGRRRILVALVAACALTTTVATAVPGTAQEMEDRKERVEREIDRTEAHLDQSSAELAAATRDVQEAVVALGTARDALARTRGELAAAQALDSRMKAELASAVRELASARDALARSRAHVREQEDEMRRVVVHQYATGDPALMTLSTVFTTQDTAGLTSQLNSFGNVLDKEGAMLARLEASQVMLAMRESTFEKAKRRVAQRRAAAAENLERKAALESQAEEAEASIAELVDVRSQARQAAAQARTEDLSQLRQLEDERQEIAALLQRRAEEARRRAEAAARAEAEAAAREAAQAEAAARRAARSEAAARRKSRPEADAATPPAPAPKAPAPEEARETAPSTNDDGLISPVDGYLTSSYGMRLHPVYKRWTLHDGTDFGASCGTPIRAAASGTVIAKYYNSGYGNRIIVDHGLRRGVGLGTSYNHLSSYSTYVGETVQRGEVIGYVGTTGYSTGCHLHFMVFENGATVNPMSWL